MTIFLVTFYNKHFAYLVNIFHQFKGEKKNDYSKDYDPLFCKKKNRKKKNQTFWNSHFLLC